jgi:uncharacterized delta-60 repeat protein
MLSFLRRKTHPITRRPSVSARPHLEQLEDRRLLSGGVLDPTFGTGGVTTSLLATGGVASAVATYPQTGTANDGKIVVVGSDYLPNDYTELAVVRYNLDGSLDKSFGNRGEATIAVKNSRARAVAIQPDGKILAAGESGSEFAIVRYNVDGSLDRSFGTKGVATTSITAKGFDEIFALGLQADGKIVVAGGTTPPNSTTRKLAVARFNANGTLDTSFGEGGKAVDLPTSPLEGGGTLGMGLDIDPTTGNIFVEAANGAVNNFGYDAMVVRYTSAGVIDKSFAGKGYVVFDGSGTLPIMYSSASIALEPSDHLIVVAGRSAGYTECLARLKQNGSPDPNFGPNQTGFVDTSVPTTSNRASVRFQADGSILVGETTHSNSMMLTCFKQIDGSLDASFGNSGVATYTDSSYPQLEGIALEPDGRIVVTGLPGSGYIQVIVVRFLVKGPQIGAFTASPSPASTGANATLTAASVTALNPGSTVTQVTFYVDSNGDGVLDASDTQLTGTFSQSAGTWTLTFTATTAGLTPGSYTLFAQAEDSYGALSDPLSLVLQVT